LGQTRIGDVVNQNVVGLLYSHNHETDQTEDEQGINETGDRQDNDHRDFSQKPDEFYNEILYQVIGDLVSNVKPKDVIISLSSQRVLWDHPAFSQIKKKLDEQDDFIMNPIEVEEGVLECKKCGSKRVHSYTKQTRSADEPATTFAECVNPKCRQRWTENH
jgi:DNA-directed RNA polymerase subunit M/transcription elongation factor TFIIS